MYSPSFALLLLMTCGDSNSTLTTRLEGPQKSGPSAAVRANHTRLGGGSVRDRRAPEEASVVTESPVMDPSGALLVASASGAAGRAPKIRFDLRRLDADGLQGSPGGRRALHYEYCIPDRPETVEAVAAIDPTLQIHRGSPGRVGCREGELLCLGHTHQPGYRSVLERLSELPSVGEIREAFFE